MFLTRKPVKPAQKMKTTFLAAHALVIAALTGGLRIHAAEESLPKVGPIPPQIRQYFKLHPFYRKYTHVYGFPIVSSEKPSDYALLEAAYVIRGMVHGRPDVLRVLGTNRYRCAVIGVTEFPSDLPEDRRQTVSENEEMDKRARGYGGHNFSMSEENLLKLRGDAFPWTSMLMHEFAHSVHLVAMKALDPTFDDRLGRLYEDSKAAGHWKGEYRMINRGEYWAVAVEIWFRRHDKSEYKIYLPELDKFIADTFGNPAWRYQLPQDRSALGHLAGFDREHAPGYDQKLLEKRYPSPR